MWCSLDPAIGTRVAAQSLQPEAAAPPGAADPAPAAPAADSGKRHSETGSPERTAAETMPDGPVPLAVAATAAWADAWGSARCAGSMLADADLAARVASTVRHASSQGALGIAVGGTLGDHPVIARAAERHPGLLAELLSAAGYAALGLGVSDLTGALLGSPELAVEITRRGISIVASNLECAGEAFCKPWNTAEDPLLVLQRANRRYAYISVLPDDFVDRVEPAGGRVLRVQPALRTVAQRTREARAAGVDLVVASIDHGPEPTAAVQLAAAIGALPEEGRPDLLLSPSAGEQILFFRPLQLNPAVAGIRAGAVTAIGVSQRLAEDDLDVLVRPVPLREPDAELTQAFSRLGADYCAVQGPPLTEPVAASSVRGATFVQLAGNAARALARADIAILDPSAFDLELAVESGALQRGQVARAVPLDSRLAVADVTLDWLEKLANALGGARPLELVGAGVVDGEPAIEGRAPVPGASYRVVTSAVLARSGRLPPGAGFEPLTRPEATLKRALLAYLDGRTERWHPAEATEWVLRLDGQLQFDLTAIHNPAEYSEPALQVGESRELVARFAVNLDADAPELMFENVAQLSFDRDYETSATSKDLASLQSTFTYRGLWPSALYYPHPFVEGYVETQLDAEGLDHHPLRLRPEAGVRSLFSRVLSLKLSAGFQVDATSPDPTLYPGFIAELVMKPWTAGTSRAGIQMQGDVSYTWLDPSQLDSHVLRAQFTTGVQIFGPLQFTLMAIGLLREDDGGELASGIGVFAGLRLTMVERMIGS